MQSSMTKSTGCWDAMRRISSGRRAGSAASAAREISEGGRSAVSGRESRQPESARPLPVAGHTAPRAPPVAQLLLRDSSRSKRRATRSSRSIIGYKAVFL